MSVTRNAEAQKQIVSFLISNGADPNALDKSGVSALHRAVRTRGSGAVKALLAAGAEVQLKNKNGSTPLHLAVQNTGKSGSGSKDAKANQKEIIELLIRCGADTKATDAQGKTVLQWIKEEWIMSLFRSE